MIERNQKHITKILSGKGLAANIRQQLKEKIKRAHKRPGLAVILVGHDPASETYVNFKVQASKEVGLYLETFEFDEDVSERKLLKVIEKLNKNKKIHGILVQLPLPKQIDTLAVLEAIDPDKDVDGFHPENVGWLSIGAPILMPATTRGIWTLVESVNENVVGKLVVMVGASNIVGKPTAQLFLNKGATVTVCHKKTKDLAHHTQQADILITATGVPELITADMVKKGVMVIDVGIARIDDKTVGDVDFDAVAEKASYITPVPGGVGPMTVASLLQNTWDAMCAIHDIDDDEWDI
jgi:methylenetetrahydrofolate dehydrogenase (NADP+) / methenyltetrahydrofolate cyclohydrolase